MLILKPASFWDLLKLLCGHISIVSIGALDESNASGRDALEEVPTSHLDFSVRPLQNREEIHILLQLEDGLHHSITPLLIFHRWLVHESTKMSTCIQACADTGEMTYTEHFQQLLVQQMNSLLQRETHLPPYLILGQTPFCTWDGWSSWYPKYSVLSTIGFSSFSWTACIFNMTSCSPMIMLKRNFTIVTKYSSKDGVNIAVDVIISYVSIAYGGRDLECIHMDDSIWISPEGAHMMSLSIQTPRSWIYPMCGTSLVVV